MVQTGSFQWMKSLNKSIILNKIRTNGPISRAQIAKDTKLTPPTVSSIVKEWLDQGFVKESSLGTSQGGRKPTMLEMNNSEFFVIGIDAGPNEMEMILSDLSGEVVDGARTPITLPIQEHDFMEMLQDGIRRFLHKYNHLRDKIIGIGVAMHGVVDAASGISLYAPNLNLRDMPVKEKLEAAFPYSVKVENDARAMALGEAWFGESGEAHSMMAVNIGRGIGAGMVIDGKLYHGEFDTAGEVGHMTIDIHGETCQCGNTGCLQTMASGPALAAKAERLAASGEAAALSERASRSGGVITGELVYETALAGDEVCRKLLEDTGRYIGIGFTNLIHVMNPGKIVIGGGVSNAASYILPPIKEEIKKRALTTKAKHTDVVVSGLGDQATALGAVSLVLVELFDPEVIVSQ
ncbi:ROK family transcriptional regulator [Salibacterium qingdaonense]|uniref:ROK family protein (Putative glucokinase) n=1 Tax=Salibacterium qingdaonense TaxID=266892 RepID=A0A1I4P5X2_9BACI|nr:ROK family transcriptional regulator [Salibacterium qingdaonense]SFM22947.1 ROK family protein (putative glucokinase) [Salibacterium qingdaonense]